MVTDNEIYDQCNYNKPVPNNRWENDTVDSQHSHFLYITFTPVLILLCIFSIIFNLILLLSVIWIRRPLSPTLYISLSLSGTDLYTSFLLGLSVTLNSLLPEGFQVYLINNCMSLGLEALRLGAIVTTAGHLIMLAFNHYIGILRPLHYPATVTHGTVTIFMFFLWILPPSILFAYFNMIPCQAFQSPQCQLYEYCISYIFLFVKKKSLLLHNFFQFFNGIQIQKYIFYSTFWCSNYYGNNILPHIYNSKKTSSYSFIV